MQKLSNRSSWPFWKKLCQLLLKKKLVMDGMFRIFCLLSMFVYFRKSWNNEAIFVWLTASPHLLFQIACSLFLSLFQGHRGTFCPFTCFPHTWTLLFLSLYGSYTSRSTLPTAILPHTASCWWLFQATGAIHCYIPQTATHTHAHKTHTWILVNTERMICVVFPHSRRTRQE